VSRPSRKSSSRRGRRSSHKRKIPSETFDVVIDDIGAGGDGLASANDKKLYIPGVLTGETVRVKTKHPRGDGIVCEVMDVIQPSPQRNTPICPYFGRCGGCQLQHLKAEAYADWKHQRVARVLAQRGFQDVDVLAPVLIGPTTRRRVTFSAEKNGAKVHLGFNAQASHDLQDIASCPLLVDDLNQIIEPLKAMLSNVLKDRVRARIFITSCHNGLDILIEGRGGLELPQREAIADFVKGGKALRVAWTEPDYPPEPVAMVELPVINLSGVLVELPMGGFLQASVAGEQAILAQVKTGVGGAGRIADLYCGLGSFTLPLSQQGLVRAIDMIEPPVRALERAAGRCGLGGHVVAEVRDLDRQPLDVKDLSKFDAVVFDPPRIGAGAQAAELANSTVSKVVAVSCNPATFARDARILVDGGYRLIDVLPVDQFTYSAHVELVARFER